MADLNAAIRDMLKSGMSESEVLENLRQLGVGNPEEVFRKATETLKPMEPPAAQTAPEGLFSKASSQLLSAAMPGDTEGKLDEALALLKALQETNKKILETNRDILLRLKG